MEIIPDIMDANLIKERLIQIGYLDNVITDETVKRLSFLTGKPLELFQDWLSNDIMPYFEPINGVGSDFLIQKLNMKAPALAIAYAMLELEPKENANYFKHLSENIIGFYPNITR